MIGKVMESGNEHQFTDGFLGVWALNVPKHLAEHSPGWALGRGMKQRSLRPEMGTNGTIQDGERIFNAE